MSQVYLGLGSNIEPAHHISGCLEALHLRFMNVQTATIYQTAAIGFAGADFLNTVVGLETDLPIAALKAELRALEERFGRQRGAEKYAARSLDIDLLLYDQVVSSTDKLPHPDILRYPFVLYPLCELAPTLIHPTYGISLAQLAEQLQLDRSQMYLVLI